jgi:hypothetical protein
MRHSSYLTEYDNPQGNGNYGYAEVADPEAGRWTALISTNASSGGGTVAVKAQAATAAWTQFGTLSANSLSLAGGASGSFSLTVDTPSQPGDQDGSIVLDSSAGFPSFAAQTSIPVTLRALAATPAPSTTFTGTLTGGNGRAPDTGQTNWYGVSIPSGTPVLNAEVSTRSAADTVFAELIDPSGAAVSSAVNTLTSGGTNTPEKALQLHVLSPAAGTWTLMLDFYNLVSGTAISQPFKVTLNDTPAKAAAAGLPDSAGTQLAAGTPVIVSLKVTNKGNAPEAYFVDPRLAGEAVIPLVSSTGADLALPNLAPSIPTYMVPSDATNIDAQMVTTKPAFFDAFWPFGDPDLASTVGDTSTLNFSAPDISPGEWTMGAFLKGPDGKTGQKSVPASTTFTATAPAFDSTITSPTGDLWLLSTNPAATLTPVIVNPGQTATIPVTITPLGSSGTTVSGTLYLDDASIIPGIVTDNVIPLTYPEASQVAGFSYEYTIK